MKNKAKEGLFLGIGLFVAFVLGIVVVHFAVPQDVARKVGIPSNENLIVKSNNTTSTCAGVASLIEATNTARTSFFAQISPTATNTVTLCRTSNIAAQCQSGGSGIILIASTTPRYEQRDGYIGPYSCISSTASTTIGIWSSPSSTAGGVSQ